MRLCEGMVMMCVCARVCATITTATILLLYYCRVWWLPEQQQHRLPCVWDIFCNDYDSGNGRSGAVRVELSIHYSIIPTANPCMYVYIWLSGFRNSARVFPQKKERKTDNNFKISSTRRSLVSYPLKICSIFFF